MGEARTRGTKNDRIDAAISNGRAKKRTPYRTPKPLNWIDELNAIAKDYHPQSYKKRTATVATVYGRNSTRGMGIKRTRVALVGHGYGKLVEAQKRNMERAMK